MYTNVTKKNTQKTVTRFFSPTLYTESCAPTSFVHSDGFSDVRHQQPVDHETGSVFAGDANLPDGLSPRHQRLVRFLGEFRRLHHFEQLHDGHGVEEVKAAESVFSACHRRYFLNAQ